MGVRGGPSTRVLPDAPLPVDPRGATSGPSHFAVHGAFSFPKLSRVSISPKSKILGLGAATPDKLLTNADLEKLVDTSEEWILTRTGIRERRVLSDGERISDFGTLAARRALDAAGLGPGDIDAIIGCVYTPDYIAPSCACIMHGALGLGSAAAFDLNAACSGFVYGLEMADLMIRGGRYRNVIVVGLDAQTRWVDWSDRATCILFGDGAGAVVVGRTDGEDGRGILSTFLGADGTGAEMLKVEASGSAVAPSSPRGCIAMSGREVFKFAVRIMGPAVDEALRRAEMTVDAIDLLVPHQANIRIIDAAAERYGMSGDRVVSNVAKYGNTSAASIPLALADAQADGRLKPGTVAALVAFGAGLTYSASIIRW